MSRKKKPLIGVTGPDRGGRAAWWATRWLLRKAGARVCWITPSRQRWVDDLDGLVIGGGADVAPKLYGQERMEEVFEAARERQTLKRKLVILLLFPLIYLVRLLLSGHTTAKEDSARDDLELGLIHKGLDGGIPMLGICRGAQLINVALGGSLHQALTDFYTETPQIRSVLPRKEVELEPDSRLVKILECNPCRVNALHSQAINEPGEGLRIVAREATGVTQAVEHRDRPFIIGVQWHPEFMPQSEGQFGLFIALTQAATDKQQERLSEAVSSS
ncbi:gamma-glutamyl-gamma-aminobutyrate hydrolase family protein [Marinobacter sp.]|uniref:gamma-glutamyl-gamma-aminobutyrate hydrolase family protein n=1 Tax=Marinobacter sp. TaxID=50741 RepID=UPI00384C4D20